MDAIRLQNVRSITDTGWVPLRPLTIVVGRNSIGKSSLLRWLPLLSQSQNAAGSTPILWTRRDRGLVDYGSFHETLRHGAEPQEIRFGWRDSVEANALQVPDFFGLLRDENFAAESFEAESVLSSYERATYVTGLRVQIGEVNAHLTCDPGGAVTNFTINGVPAHILAPGWKWAVLQSEIVPLLQARSSTSASTTPGHEQRLEGLKTLKTRKMDDWRLRRLSESGKGWTTQALRKSLAEQEAGTATWHSDLQKLANEDPRLVELLPRYAIREMDSLVRVIGQLLQAQLTSLVYVAPFRAEPRRAERSPEPSTALDARGDALLSFMEGLGSEERQSLNDWLQEALDFKLVLSRDGLYSELRVDQGGGHHDNLADVGFGIGQVLPVAVHLWKTEQQDFEKILYSNGEIVVMEQPELHLHPAHQASVGRMLARHAARTKNSGGRLLVETHSEALINAVGEELGAGRLSSSDVSVVVFERSQPGGPVEVRVVDFDEKGYLKPPWPFGFFAA